MKKSILLLVTAIFLLSCNNDTDKGITFEKDSWENVISACNDGEEAFLNKYHLTHKGAIGKEKEIILDKYGKQKVRIISISHDYLSGDSKGGKAVLTLEFSDIVCFYQYNETKENNNWKNCELRQYLNNDFLQLLPVAFQSNIKPVDKMISIDGTSLERVSDKIFLSSLVEHNISITPRPYEGYVYEYYDYDDSFSIKRQLKFYYGNTANYYLRTPCYESSRHLGEEYYITSGGLCHVSAPHTPWGVAPIFNI